MEQASNNETLPRPVCLFFDTETTGLPVKNAQASDARQPKLVQLAFILVDDEGKERASISLIVKPDGWKIPKEASDVHGITTEMAIRYGVPLYTALGVFSHHLMQADLLVAHNIQFDLFMLEFAFNQIGRADSMDRVRSVKQHCTMKASTPIVQIPATTAMKRNNRGPYKSARMGEAYKYFTGKELEGAHDALVDVRACRVVYDCLRERVIGDV